MHSQENEKPRYSTLHYGVRAKLDISWSEYVLLDMVYHLSAKYGFCTKTVSAIARDLGQSFNGTKAIIQRLVDRELLTDDQRGLVCAPAYIDIAYLDKDVDTSRIAKNAKIAKSAKTHDKTIAKTAMGLRKVQPIAKTSDKNNIRTTLELQITNHMSDVKSPPFEAMQIERAMVGKIRANYPKLNFKEPDGRWAEDIAKIHRIDGYEWDDIVKVAKFSQEDEFWMRNIHSGQKLRKQFNLLMARMEGSRRNARVY